MEKLSHTNLHKTYRNMYVPNLPKINYLVLVVSKREVTLFTDDFNHSVHLIWITIHSPFRIAHNAIVALWRLYNSNIPSVSPNEASRKGKSFYILQSDNWLI